MSAPIQETVTDNAAWSAATPRLSVLIPTFRDDPTALLRALDASKADGSVEIVVLDDGGGDEALAARIGKIITGLKRPARFVRLSRNAGRAQGRNRLTASIRETCHEPRPDHRQQGQAPRWPRGVPG